MVTQKAITVKSADVVMLAKIFKQCQIRITIVGANTSTHVAQLSDMTHLDGEEILVFEDMWSARREMVEVPGEAPKESWYYDPMPQLLAHLVYGRISDDPNDDDEKLTSKDKMAVFNNYVQSIEIVFLPSDQWIKPSDVIGIPEKFLAVESATAVSK